VRPLGAVQPVLAVEPWQSLRPCVQGKDDRGGGDWAEWHIPWTHTFRLPAAVREAVGTCAVVGLPRLVAQARRCSGLWSVWANGWGNSVIWSIVVSS
jgi:hypothetical protein